MYRPTSAARKGSGEHEPERCRQQRNGRVHGAEYAIEGTPDDDVEGDHEGQAQGAVEPYANDNLEVKGARAEQCADRRGVPGILRDIGQDEARRRACFGRSLIGLSDALHLWAEGHRASGLPDDAPKYLLRGYSQMLMDSRQIARLVALVVDEARPDAGAMARDAAALAEVDAAMGLVRADETRDLAALGG